LIADIPPMITMNREVPFYRLYTELASDAGNYQVTTHILSTAFQLSGQQAMSEYTFNL
jgi:hypothetical protein